MDVLIKVPRSAISEICIACKVRAGFLIDHAARLRAEHERSEYWMLRAASLEASASDLVDFCIDLEGRSNF